MSAPKTLNYSSEPETSLKNKAVVVTTIILISFMVLVTIVNLIIPLIFDHDIISWINSEKLWVLIFGLFIPAVLITIINGKFEPVYVQQFQNQPQQKPQNTIAPCYCCSKEFPVTDMKVLLICKNCAKDQHVE